MSAFRERCRKMLPRMIVWLPCVLPFYLARLHLGPFPTTVLELFLLVIFGLFTWTEGFQGWKRGWIRVGTWQPFLIAWGISSLIAVFVAPDWVGGLGGWRAYILEPLLAFVLLAAVVLEREQIQALRRSLLLVVFPLVLWGLIQFVTGKGIPHPWDVSISAGRRATGPYPFPNALALFVAPIGAYAFAMWVRVPRQWFLLGVFLTTIVGILLARSDGGLIAVACAVVLTLLGVRWGRRVIVAGSVLVVAILLALPSVRAVVWRELTFQGWSGRVRVWMWQETWQMLKDHWFFGAGFGGYPTVFDPYHKKRFIEIFQYPHTLLFNVWSEVGLLGLAAFTALVGRWVKTALQIFRHQRVLDALIIVAPLVTILVHGLVDVSYFKNDLAVQFWLFAFLLTIVRESDRVDATKAA